MVRLFPDLERKLLVAIYEFPKFCIVLKIAKIQHEQ